MSPLLGGRERRRQAPHFWRVKVGRPLRRGLRLQGSNPAQAFWAATFLSVNCGR